MNEADTDRRLGALLQDEPIHPDPVFAERVMAIVRVEAEIAAARRRALRRLALESAVATALGLTFYFLSQEQAPLPDGMLSLHGPAMAGMVMLLLWGFVSNLESAGPGRIAGAP